MKWHHLAILAVFGLLFAALLFIFMQNNSLQTELSSLREEQQQSLAKIEKLESDYAVLESSRKELSNSLVERTSQLSSANSEIAALQSQLSQKKRELLETSSNLEEQRQKAAAIASELSSLEKNVNDSFSWFKGNAELPSDYGWKADIFKKRVLEDCVDGNELNIGCISYLMENTAFSIHYRTDIISGKTDHLQSLKETMDLGWGDCEDYSLLFKATLNSVKSSLPGLETVTFAPGGSSDFRIYPKESNPSSQVESYWYVPNSRKARLGNMSQSYFYVICYRSGPSTGHCTVAISPNSIQSSSQVSSLSGAEVFEPQNGLYLGKVGSQFPICGEEGCTNAVNAISLVISGTDLYKFEGGKWVGYEDYLQKIRDAKAELGQ
jgi:hypothetical protein